MKIAVITGDIVESRLIASSDREKLYKDFNSFLIKMKKEKKVADFEFFRGDSLQCIVKDVSMSLRIALVLKAYVKSYITEEQRKKYEQYKGKGVMAMKGYFPGKQDIRLSIGIGDVDFISKSLAHSDGEAFYNSGEGLDDLKKQSYTLTLKTSSKKINEEIEGSILLLGAVVDKWTNNQAEFVFNILQGREENELSNLLKISQSAVSQRKKTSQWYAIEKYLNYFETMIKLKFS